MDEGINEPHSLKHPPIREAIVELRVADADRQSRLGALKALRDKLKDRFPNTVELSEFHDEINFSPKAAPEAKRITEGLIGYRLSDKGDQQVLQLRVDRLVYARTFSEGHTYEGWHTLEEPSKELWDHYRHSVSPKLTRLGIRYINRIITPKIDDVLSGMSSETDSQPNVRTFHVVAGMLHGRIQSTVARSTLEFGDQNAKAHVQQAWANQKSPETGAELILDVDVFREKLESDVDIWGALAELRRIKNQIFFDSFSKQVLGVFDK